MILIVSAADDDHVAAVEEELRRRDAAVVRLDLAEFPARAQLTVAYEDRGPARILLHRGGETIDLSRATAVWSRRPQAASPDAAVANKTIRDYVSQEVADAWIGAASLLECPWMPAPRWLELRATYKALQLQMAASLGFEIPSTLMSSRVDDVLQFHRRHHGRIITKTIHNRLLPVDRSDGYDAYLLTEPVANRDLSTVASVEYCPITVQPYVEKRVELRVIVVGDRVFTAAVDSQWTNHTRHDWRRVDIHRGRYTVHGLPADVERRSVALVRRLGLSFGAIDLILTPDGRYVFLEVNPNGTWLWVERVTGLPVAAAIADVLTAGEPVQPKEAVARETSGGSASAGATQPRESVGDMRAESAIHVAPAHAASRRRTKPIAPAAVSAVAEYLARMVRARTSPDLARAGLRRLQARYPGLRMELLWEVETALGNPHYDVLLVAEDGTTVSVAFSAPGSGVPWALRHLHHARESDLVRVNGDVLNMQTVMGYLDGLWADARLLESLVDGCVIRAEVAVRGITAKDSEVRRAVEVFERKHGLTSPVAKDEWLRQRGWSSEDLEYELHRQVVAFKLRKQISAGRLDNNVEPAARDAMSRRLFDEWLAERRRAASIEWLWGDREHAPSQAGIFAGVPRPDAR